MCRALKVLCAAPGREALASLKRAAVSAGWELVAGATSLAELVKQVDESLPDVVVIDPGIGADAGLRVRSALEGVRIVSVGTMEGADAQAASLEEVRAAVLGVPSPGGPVRR